MRSVSLVGTDISTSAVGYGCSGLARPNSERERAALLQTAFDVGIRHFDTARYYGYGASETILGNFLRDAGCRGEVTITSKFGIDPPAVGRVSGLGWIVGLARRMAALHPVVRRVLSRSASRGVQGGRFDVENARRSLETSLRALGTDYLDLWLLHDGTLADTRTPGLQAFLDQVRQEGKIRAYGIGSSFVHVPDIASQALPFARVVQTSHTIEEPCLRELPPDSERATLTHSVLKVLPALDAALSSSANRQELDRWVDAAGLPRDTSLARLLLGWAQTENPAGIVLFSSLAPDRIRANATVLPSLLDAAQWREFERLVKTYLAPTAHAA